MHVTLKDGPVAGKSVPSSWFDKTTAAARITVAFVDPPDLRLRSPGEIVKPLKEKKRIAVYRLTTDEDGVANFVGWDDELFADPAMVNAMCNAPDDAILKLIDDVSKAS